MNTAWFPSVNYELYQVIVISASPQISLYSLTCTPYEFLYCYNYYYYYYKYNYYYIYHYCYVQYCSLLILCAWCWKWNVHLVYRIHCQLVYVLQNVTFMAAVLRIFHSVFDHAWCYGDFYVLASSILFVVLGFLCFYVSGEIDCPYRCSQRLVTRPSSLLHRYCLPGRTGLWIAYLCMERGYH